MNFQEVRYMPNGLGTRIESGTQTGVILLWKRHNVMRENSWNSSELPL